MMLITITFSRLIFAGLLICASIPRSHPAILPGISNRVSPDTGLPTAADTKSTSNDDHEGLQDTGLKSMINKRHIEIGDHRGLITVRGRIIEYKYSGRIYSIQKPWVYDCTLKDRVSRVEVSVFKYIHQDDCIRAAVNKLFEELTLRNLVTAGPTGVLPIDPLDTTTSKIRSSTENVEDEAQIHISNKFELGQKNGEIRIRGREIQYTYTGRYHSPEMPWVYDCRATDTTTLVSVKLNRYLRQDSCVNAAVNRVIAKLKLLHLLEVQTVSTVTTDQTTTPGQAVMTTVEKTITTIHDRQDNMFSWSFHGTIIAVAIVVLVSIITFFVIWKNSKKYKSLGSLFLIKVSGLHRKWTRITGREPMLLSEDETGEIQHGQAGSSGGTHNQDYGLSSAGPEIQINSEPIDSADISLAVQPRQDHKVAATDITPDVSGFYKHFSIGHANPTEIQLDPQQNYVMHTSRRKGLIFILNNCCSSHHNYDEAVQQGSKVDVANIQHVFEQIGFESILRQNLSADEIQAELDALVVRINTDGADVHRSVVLVLMSWGKQAGILGTDEKLVTLDQIMDKFSARNCPILMNKPKIMFIQTCCGGRSNLPGSRLDFDAQVSNRCQWRQSIEQGGSEPDDTDVFIALARLDGYFSIRDGVNGSWFIQALCEELIAKAHQDDLDTMMNRVKRRVMKLVPTVSKQNPATEEDDETMRVCKRGVRKNIYFMPKYPPTYDK